MKRFEEKQAQSKQEHNPLVLNKPVSPNDEEKLLVKHLVGFKQLKFLFTKTTKELITHHLVSGFNYSQFRKTDFIDMDEEKDKQNLK